MPKENQGWWQDIDTRLTDLAMQIQELRTDVAAVKDALAHLQRKPLG